MSMLQRMGLILTMLALISGMSTRPAAAATEQVVFAGGCFWGMQAVFESLRGVSTAVAGYAGGSGMLAHYETVSTGATGHAESVQVTYDPSIISFKQLLDVYFLVAHDPTQRNRQGPDEGPQYRSEIFYETASQRSAAASYIAALSRKHVYTSPVVTELEPLRGFFAAENYHQDYLVHNPDEPYIVYNDMPKLRALRERFPKLVRNDSAPMRALTRS